MAVSIEANFIAKLSSQDAIASWDKFVSAITKGATVISDQAAKQIDKAFKDTTKVIAETAKAQEEATQKYLSDIDRRIGGLQKERAATEAILKEETLVLLNELDRRHEIELQRINETRTAKLADATLTAEQILKIEAEIAATIVQLDTDTAAVRTGIQNSFFANVIELNRSSFGAQAEIIKQSSAAYYEYLNSVIVGSESFKKAVSDANAAMQLTKQVLDEMAAAAAAYTSKFRSETDFRIEAIANERQVATAILVQQTQEEQAELKKRTDAQISELNRYTNELLLSNTLTGAQQIAVQNETLARLGAIRADASAVDLAITKQASDAIAAINQQSFVAQAELLNRSSAAYLTYIDGIVSGSAISKATTEAVNAALKTTNTVLEEAATAATAYSNRFKSEADLRIEVIEKERQQASVILAQQNQEAQAALQLRTQQQRDELQQHLNDLQNAGLITTKVKKETADYLLTLDRDYNDARKAIDQQTNEAILAADQRAADATKNLVDSQKTAYQSLADSIKQAYAQGGGGGSGALNVIGSLIPSQDQVKDAMAKLQSALGQGFQSLVSGSGITTLTSALHGNGQAFQSLVAPITNVVAALGPLGAAIAGAVTGFVALAAASINLVKELYDVTTAVTKTQAAILLIQNITGASDAQIANITFGIKKFGLDALTAGIMLERLTLKINESVEGGKKANKIFDTLGISVVNSAGQIKNAGEIFEDLVKKTQKGNLTLEEDEALIRLFTLRGVKAFEAAALGYSANAQVIADSGVLITASQKAMINEFRNSSNALDLYIQGIKTNIAVAAAPALAEMNRAFIELIKNFALAGPGIAEIIKGFLDLGKYILEVGLVVNAFVQVTKLVGYTLFGLLRGLDELFGMIARELFHVDNLNTSFNTFNDVLYRVGEGLGVIAHPLDTLWFIFTGMPYSIDKNQQALNANAAAMTRTAIAAKQAVQDLEELEKEYKRLDDETEKNTKHQIELIKAAVKDRVSIEVQAAEEIARVHQEASDKSLETLKKELERRTAILASERNPQVDQSKVDAVNVQINEAIAKLDELKKQAALTHDILTEQQIKSTEALYVSLNRQLQELLNPSIDKAKIEEATKDIALIADKIEREKTRIARQGAQDRENIAKAETEHLAETELSAAERTRALKKEEYEEELARKRNLVAAQRAIQADPAQGAEAKKNAKEAEEKYLKDIDDLYKKYELIGIQTRQDIEKAAADQRQKARNDELAFVNLYFKEFLRIQTDAVNEAEKQHTITHTKAEEARHEITLKGFEIKKGLIEQDLQAENVSAAEKEQLLKEKAAIDKQVSDENYRFKKALRDKEIEDEKEHQALLRSISNINQALFDKAITEKTAKLKAQGASEETIDREVAKLKRASLTDQIEGIDNLIESKKKEGASEAEINDLVAQRIKLEAEWATANAVATGKVVSNNKKAADSYKGVTGPNTADRQGNFTDEQAQQVADNTARAAKEAADKIAQAGKDSIEVLANMYSYYDSLVNQAAALTKDNVAAGVAQLQQMLLDLHANFLSFGPQIAGLYTYLNERITAGLQEAWKRRDALAQEEWAKMAAEAAAKTLQITNALKSLHDSEVSQQKSAFDTLKKAEDDYLKDKAELEEKWNKQRDDINDKYDEQDLANETKHKDALQKIDDDAAKKSIDREKSRLEAISDLQDSFAMGRLNSLEDLLVKESDLRTESSKLQLGLAQLSRLQEERKKLEAAANKGDEEAKKRIEAIDSQIKKIGDPKEVSARQKEIDSQLGDIAATRDRDKRKQAEEDTILASGKSEEEIKIALDALDKKYDEEADYYERKKQLQLNGDTAALAELDRLHIEELKRIDERQAEEVKRYLAVIAAEKQARDDAKKQADDDYTEAQAKIKKDREDELAKAAAQYVKEQVALKTHLTEQRTAYADAMTQIKADIDARLKEMGISWDTYFAAIKQGFKDIQGLLDSAAGGGPSAGGVGGDDSGGTGGGAGQQFTVDTNNGVQQGGGTPPPGSGTGSDTGGKSGNHVAGQNKNALENVLDGILERYKSGGVSFDDALEEANTAYSSSKYKQRGSVYNAFTKALVTARNELIRKAGEEMMKSGKLLNEVWSDADRERILGGETGYAAAKGFGHRDAKLLRDTYSADVTIKQFLDDFRAGKMSYENFMKNLNGSIAYMTPNAYDMAKRIADDIQKKRIQDAKTDKLGDATQTDTEDISNEHPGSASGTIPPGGADAGEPIKPTRDPKVAANLLFLADNIKTQKDYDDVLKAMTQAKAAGIIDDDDVGKIKAHADYYAFQVGLFIRKSVKQDTGTQPSVGDIGPPGDIKGNTTVTGTGGTGPTTGSGTQISDVARAVIEEVRAGKLSIGEGIRKLDALLANAEIGVQDHDEAIKILNALGGGGARKPAKETGGESGWGSGGESGVASDFDVKKETISNVATNATSAKIPTKTTNAIPESIQRVLDAYRDGTLVFDQKIGAYGYAASLILKLEKSGYVTHQDVERGLLELAKIDKELKAKTLATTKPTGGPDAVQPTSTDKKAAETSITAVKPTDVSLGLTLSAEKLKPELERLASAVESKVISSDNAKEEVENLYNSGKISEFQYLMFKDRLNRARNIGGSLSDSDTRREFLGLGPKGRKLGAANVPTLQPGIGPLGSPDTIKNVLNAAKGDIVLNTGILRGNTINEIIAAQSEETKRKLAKEGVPVA